MIEGKPVLLFCENRHENGCNFYRLRQPGLKLLELNAMPTALSRDLGEEEFELWLEKADVIFTKIASPKLYQFLKEKPEDRKVIFDVDDNIFAVDPFNPAYEKRGVKEVDYRLPDGRIVKLRDGEGGFNVEENKRSLALYRECIARADLVLTPSPVLSGYLKRFTPKTRVVKNFVNFDFWSPLDIVKDEFVRIGYQGGYAHFQDFWEVRDVLLEIMTGEKNVKLVLMGQTYEGALKDFPEDRVERHGWVGMEAYPYKFKSLNIDIGIAPLCNTEFNACKSELKWTEYSALGIPTVASNIPPYSLKIWDGETGYLCGKKEEWVETIRKLVESPELRKKIGGQARSHVLENYSLEKGIDQYVDAVKSLFRKGLIAA